MTSSHESIPHVFHPETDARCRSLLWITFEECQVARWKMRSNRRQENRLPLPSLISMLSIHTRMSTHLRKNHLWSPHSGLITLFNLSADLAPCLSSAAIDYFCPACMKLRHKRSNFGSCFDRRAENKSRLMWADQLNDCCRMQRARTAPS